MIIGLQGSIYGRNFKKPKDCSNGICDYPTKEIISIINNNKQVLSYFGNIIQPVNSVHIQNRNKFSDPKPFCDTRVYTRTPQFEVDVDGIIRTIANVGKQNFTQTVTYVECRYVSKHTLKNFFLMLNCFSSHRNRECYDNNFPKTKCLPVFNIIKLLTVNLILKDLEFHSFKVPSGCVCTYYA